MAIPIRYLMMFLCGVATCLFAFGQAPVAAPVTLKFTAYAVKPPTEEIFYLPRPGGSAKSIRFYTSAKSAVQEYNGSDPVSFFHEQPSADPAQPPVRKLLARVSVPDGVVEPLFLFFPNPDFIKDPNTLPYLVYVFDDAADRLPAGHVALINASGLEFVGQFNTDIKTLSRGLNDPIRVGGGMRMELRTMVRGKYYQAYHSSHTFGTNERALILLLPPLHPGSIEVQVRILRSAVADPK